MKGLRIDDATEFPIRFAKAFGPVLDAFAGHYWYIDGYGPFSITDKPNFRELDAQLDQDSVHWKAWKTGRPAFGAQVYFHGRQTFWLWMRERLLSGLLGTRATQGELRRNSTRRFKLPQRSSSWLTKTKLISL